MTELSPRDGDIQEHVNDHQFQQLIEGTLPPEEQTWVESHLKLCETCLHRLSVWGERASGFPNGLSGAGASQPHPDFDAGLVDRITRALQVSEEASLPDEKASVTTALLRIRSIGRGGHGEVFEYHDEQLGRSVAIKLLQTRWASSPAHVARFRREMQLTASIDHPGCPAVYGRGMTEDGREFFLMQLVSGEPLDAAISRLHRERGKRRWSRGDRPLRDFLQILRQLCQTMAEAHQKGIIHRDLKPQNVRVHTVGHPVILDWGIAKRLEVEESTSALEPTLVEPVELTQAGQRLGTFVYMAPEQARGDHAQVREQTDVYGLGAILYEILLGQPPHAKLVRKLSDSSKILEALAQVPPPEFPGIPVELASICRRALQTNPSDRYPSTVALAEDLDRWMASEPVEAHSYRWWERIGLSIRRQPGLFATATAATVVILLGGAAIRQLSIEAQLQRRAAVDQQNIAEQRFRLALDTYTEMIRDVREELEDEGPTRAARQELLQRAVDGIQRLIESAADLPGAERIWIEAQKELADLQRLEQGRLQESLESYERLIRDMRGQPIGVRETDWFQKEWLDILNRRATTIETLQGATQASPYWDEVLHEMDQFASRQSNQPIGLLTRAQAAVLRGRRTESQGAELLPQTIAHFESALTAIESVPPPKADDPIYLSEKSLILTELARTLVKATQFERAIALQKQAIEIDTRILELSPSRDALLGLSQDQNGLGIYHRRHGDAESAVSILQDAIDTATKNQLRYPDDLQFQRVTGQLRHNLGTALRQLGRFAEAREALQANLAEPGSLDPVTSPVAQLEDQTLSLIALAQLWEDEGDRPKALDCYLQGLQLRQAIFARDPDDLENKSEMLIAAQRTSELAEAGDVLKIAEQVSQLCRNLDGENHADAWPGSLRKNLAILYFHVGGMKMAAAEKSLLRNDLLDSNLAYKRAKQILGAIPNVPPSAMSDLETAIELTNQALKSWPSENASPAPSAVPTAN